MAVTVRQTESAPEAYPDAPEGLSSEAAAINPALIWQRIESYVAWRWSTRDVEWVIEGDGDWCPPLKPAIVSTTEGWRDGAWEAVELRPTPLGGYCLAGCGPHRIIGTVGEDDAAVPALVLEAYRRLAEYTAQINFEHPGVRSITVPDVATEEFASPSWRARALQDSGAADLLRTFRRA